MSWGRDRLKCLLIIYISLGLLSCTSEPRPSQEQHINVFVEADVATLDPIHSTNKYSSTVNGAIFEGLYHYHYLKRPYEVNPLLAANLPQISEEGYVYRIALKQGVFFHDDTAFAKGRGRELVADDVIYSWKRLADPTNRALGWWALDGWIEGLNEWRQLRQEKKISFDAPISGLSALDPYTLEIRLTRPSTEFLHRLVIPVTAIVAHEVIEHYKEEIGRHPIGTGPFVFESWRQNGQIDLRKNSNYRKSLYPNATEGGVQLIGVPNTSMAQLPLADRLTIHIFREQHPLWLSFLNGDLDYGMVPRDLAGQVFDGKELRDHYKKLGMKTLVQSKPDVTYVAINMEHPILGKNKKVRQAMALALDREIILKKFYNNSGVLAHGPIPPEIGGYDSKRTYPYGHDLEKAKKLLSEAGFPEGKGLPVFDYQTSNTSSFARQFAEFLKDQWGQIGIKIKIENNSWPELDQKIKTKKATLFDMAWNADYPDGENFLQLFYGRNISPGPNNFNFSHGEYDRLYQESLSTLPGPEKQMLYNKMVDILNEEVPAIFLLHRTFRIPFHGWLENFYESPLIYDHHKYLRVSPDRKRELRKKFR